jgi:hypothetical protein
MSIKKPDFDALLASFSSEKFKGLRDAQTTVLTRYAERHLDTPDIAIELPTGAGKSLIALLIGEAWRKEGRTVALLTGNKALAVQMEKEGNDLGVNVARMEGRGQDIPLTLRRQYRRGSAIGVMNYWVMFNTNPVVDSADLLIVDDAHLAEGALEGGFSVRIDRYTHPELFSELVGELAARLPDYASLADARAESDNPRSGVELMSFLDQQRVEVRMREIINSSAELAIDPDLRYPWQEVEERLAESNVYTSGDSISIRPYCLPAQTIPRWSDPAQRIYFSATIGDPADLQRRLGCGPIVKISSHQGAATLGRRMIVLNNDQDQFSDSAIPMRIGTVIQTALAKHPKAVWMCSSHAQASQLEQTIVPWLEENGLPSSPVWRIGNQGDEIDDFKHSDTGHLFTAGRFDGMDFAGDDCRLVVLAALPRAINDQEQFVAEYLRDASFLIGRTNQRITQALGRCNRHDEDYALYVLSDRRLAGHLSQESNRRGLPRGFQAELDLAEELDGLDTADLVSKVEQFLDTDFDEYDALLGQLGDAVPETQTSEGDDADDEVKGWLAMAGRQDYLEAESCFDRRQKRLDEGNLRELGAFVQYSQAKASHLEGQRGDPAAARRSTAALERAINRGGGSSSWFNRLRSSLHRDLQTSTSVTVGVHEFRSTAARAFDEQLEAAPPGPKLDRWRARLADDLASRSHDDFARGLGRLGELLGYSAVFPKYGGATDCRWHGIFGNRREAFTFEAKIEHKGGKAITARGVGQAHSQRARAVAELERSGFVIRGLIVTHLERLSADAAPGLGEIVVLRTDAVQALHKRIDQLLVEFSTAWSLEDPAARVAAGEALAQRLPPTGWLTDAVDAADRFLDAELILASWPK